ncbi:MAG: hypothetical protein ACKO34_02520 [Vampirovibrionales bacterium]
MQNSRLDSSLLTPLASATLGLARQREGMGNWLNDQARFVQFLDFLAWADGSSPTPTQEATPAQGNSPLRPKEIESATARTLPSAEARVAEAPKESPRAKVEEAPAPVATPTRPTQPPLTTLAWKELSEQDKAWIHQQLHTAQLSKQLLQELGTWQGLGSTRSLAPLEGLMGDTQSNDPTPAQASARTKALLANVQHWLEQAEKTKRPIRVDVNSQTSLILAIHNGKVSATFNTVDAGGFASLSQQVQGLKETLRQKNLPVEDVLAKEDDGERRRRQRRQALQEYWQTSASS